MSSKDIIGEEENLANSEAFKVLDILLDNGEVSLERSEKLKEQYATLHTCVVQAIIKESCLQEEFESLKHILGEEERNVKERAPAGEAAAIELLREDVESAISEATLAQERQQLQQLEVQELQRQRDELATKIQELAALHAAALVPLVTGLEQEVQAIAEQLEEEKLRYEKEGKSLEDTKVHLAQVREHVNELKKEEEEEQHQMAKVLHMPEKARKQSDIVANAMKCLQHSYEQLAARLMEQDHRDKAIQQRQEKLKLEHSEGIAVIERHRIQIDNKERHVDQVKKDLELAGIEAEKILADSVDLDLQLKNSTNTKKLEHELLQKRNREKEMSLRGFKACEAELRQTQDLLPPIRHTKETLVRDKVVVESELHQVVASVKELKMELDVHMAQFLKEESRVEDKSRLFKLSCDEVGLLESEVIALKHEAQQRVTLLANLGSQRDRTARLYSQNVAKLKEAGQVSKLREMEVADLKKMKRDVSARIRDFEQLYNLVKNQRNKFVNLIQSANQSKTEMGEKLKILQNELSILQNEVLEKDKQLLQARNSHASAITERDQLRSELNRLGMTFRGKQDCVEEQMAEVDKLNSTITATEREMLRLKKQYEVVIEARNYTGIMLIDRNDELCILYEKLNVLEQLSKVGELELLKREDEIRVMNLEMKQLQRSVEVTKSLVPIVPRLDEDVAGLQKELLNARREADLLSAALENPENSQRWRKLDGKIPTKEEVAERLQHLEERLSNKKEQLLEKELILEQITNLSLQLREEAKQGRTETLDVARKASQYQTKLRSTTRRIMAIVSELSMYQATALKLHQEMEQLEASAVIARERLEQGQAPTEEAEREWLNMQRLKQVDEELHIKAELQAASVDPLNAWNAPTTAEIRPNAYIPDSLGIPKPYGGFSPFKPSETGSTMRHVRKPEPQPIVI